MARATTKKAPGLQARRTTNPDAAWVTPEEFANLVATFYGTKTIMFDKAFAEAVLGYNTGNRRIARRKLERLAGQLTRGEFVNTGEPIIMSREGVLNDGQHRLQAIVDSDAEIDLDVRFGVPRHAFTKTDTGAARTGADILSIRGIAHGAQVAQTVRLLLLYERGLPESIRDFVSNDQVNVAFDRWNDLPEAVEMVQDRSFPKGIRSTPLTATVFLANRSNGKQRLETWLDTLSSGLTSNKDDPAYQLRERLMRAPEAALGSREVQLERFALMVKSWNLYKKGESVPMREFRWKASGRGAEPFPTVIGAKL
jgi:hypothetical protein